MTQIQDVFRRYEQKYLLDERQMQALRLQLQNRMEPDAYGQSTICNLYFDTPDYRLIRSSIDKPVYKEKLRLRSYGVPAEQSMVFVELKKKYRGVVYKRRVPMTLAEARAYLLYGHAPGEDGQIRREIDWFLHFYHPEPKVYLAYDRIALTGREDPALRVTFDTAVRWREDGLELAGGDAGEPLLLPGQYLMEIKLPGAMPVWLSQLLDRLRAYPTSYSKYGAYYKQCVLAPRVGKGDDICA